MRTKHEKYEIKGFLAKTAASFLAVLSGKEMDGVSSGVGGVGADSPADRQQQAGGKGLRQR